MNVDQRKFIPPSDSFILRLLLTPISELCAGRITGRCDARRVIAAADLQQPLAEAVFRIAKTRALPTGQFHTVQFLIELCRDELLRGRSPEEIAAELNDQAAITEALGHSFDWRRLIRRRLPAEVFGPLLDVVRRIRGGRRRREVLLTLYRHSLDLLDAGVAPARVASRFADVTAAAMLLQRPRVRNELLQAELPAPLVRLIAEVTARTRLWRRERDEVARELCAHFGDGLAAGRTSEELIKAFGPVPVAAKLIRRARIRNRPAASQIGRRLSQATLASVVLATVLWGFLIVRLHTAGTPGSYDPIEAIDAARLATPADERAWPLYRQALEEFIPSEALDSWKTVDEALCSGPPHKYWAAALDQLAKNERSLNLTLEGTTRSEFGYVYRDVANDVWLHKAYMRSSAEIYKPNQNPGMIVLPQIQELRALFGLLFGAAHRAAEARDGLATVNYLEAYFRVASQLWRSAEFTIIEHNAAYRMRQAAEVLTRYVDTTPYIFEDSHLQRLHNALAELAGERFVPRHELLRSMIVESLNSMYSNDGSGNGLLTSQGIDELRQSINGSSLPSEFADWKPWLERASSSRWWETMRREMVDSTLSFVVADRAESLALAEELLRLFAEDLARPPWDGSESAFDAELTRLTESPELQQRFLPVLLLCRCHSFLFDRALIMKAQKARDTALVALALERYRRANGAWPESLAALVPEFLDAVPLDPYDGNPIRFLMRGGRPVVYSVGLDRQDDTAAEAIQHPQASVSARDWQWLPPIIAPAK
ncbi:MAG TPA: hypothetical protein VKU82_03320 [Planctomycetaceae bacterium]|nr:hypothetical protein [Planctomycetaceae bacterium]